MTPAMRPAYERSRRYEQSTAGWLAVQSAAQKTALAGMPAATSWLVAHAHPSK